MKQPQYRPLDVAQQALVIFAAEKGYLEDVELNKIQAFEQGLLDYAKQNAADLMQRINEHPDYSDENVQALADLISKFKAAGTY